MISVYDQIGGRDAVETAVDMLYVAIENDPVTAPYFEHTDMREQKRHMRSFLVVALDGPNEYMGKKMDEAHVDRGVTDEAFDHVVDHLSDVLQELSVPKTTAMGILDKVAELRGRIVTA